MNYKEQVKEKREQALIIEQVGGAIEQILNKVGLSYSSISIDENRGWNAITGWNKHRSITVKIFSEQGENPAWKPITQ